MTFSNFAEVPGLLNSEEDLSLSWTCRSRVPKIEYKCSILLDRDRKAIKPSTAGNVYCSVI